MAAYDLLDSECYISLPFAYVCIHQHVGHHNSIQPYYIFIHLDEHRETSIKVVYMKLNKTVFLDIILRMYVTCTSKPPPYPYN